jgi:hypothetical protein
VSDQGGKGDRCSIEGVALILQGGFKMTSPFLCRP